jgi:hypothetical protein
MTSNNAGPKPLDQQPINLLRKPLGRIITTDGFEQHFYDPLPGFEWMTIHMLKKTASGDPTAIVAPNCKACSLKGNYSTAIKQSSVTFPSQRRGHGPTSSDVEGVAQEKVGNRPAKRMRSQDNLTNEGSQFCIEDLQECERFIKSRFSEIATELLRLIVRSWMNELLFQHDWTSAPSWWPENAQHPPAACIPVSGQSCTHLDSLKLTRLQTC